MRRGKYKRGKINLNSKIWKIGVGVLILFLVVDAYLLATSRFFDIKSAEVVLDKVRCTDENLIKKELSVLYKNIFLVNRNLEEQIKDKFICVKSVNLKKEFPDRLKIEVFGREAVAVLAILQTEESTSSASIETLASSSARISKENISDEFLVDSEGFIFSKAEQSNIPKLFYLGDLHMGKKLNENIVENALQILRKLKNFDLNMKDVIIYPDGIFLLNLSSGKLKIIFSLKKHIETQLASLQLILTQAKMEEQEMEFIDLRYDKPVVKYVLKKGKD